MRAEADPANGAGRDLQAKLAELVREGEIAPVRAVLGQLADQLASLFPDRGSTAARTTSEGRPFPSDQLAVAATAATTRPSAWTDFLNRLSWTTCAI